MDKSQECKRMLLSGIIHTYFKAMYRPDPEPQSVLYCVTGQFGVQPTRAFGPQSGVQVAVVGGQCGLETGLYIFPTRVFPDLDGADQETLTRRLDGVVFPWEPRVPHFQVNVYGLQTLSPSS